MNKVLISTEKLSKHFRLGKGLFSFDEKVVRAVDDVSLEIYERETFALVGESGCGKSTLGRVILRLLERSSGTVSFKGQDIYALDEARMRELRKQIQIVFQDPYASLNPRMRVRDILAEPLRAHNFGTSQQIETRCKELLNMVGLRPHLINHYPHQFSGGSANASVLHVRSPTIRNSLSAMKLFLPWMSRSRPRFLISFETCKNNYSLHTYLLRMT
ncbi:ATP-binding cassette domain-containing protein [Brucella intermedia]